MVEAKYGFCATVHHTTSEEVEAELEARKEAAGVQE